MPSPTQPNPCRIVALGLFNPDAEDVARPIVGHTVRDYNLKSPGWWILCENRSNAGLDVIPFIAAGDNDRYSRLRATDVHGTQI